MQLASAILDKLIKYRFILWQIAFYQVVYLSCIFLGQGKQAYLAYLSIFIFIGVHFLVTKNRKADFFLMLQMIVLSTIGETLCYKIGLFQFKMPFSIIPIWLVGMFACFSLMLPYAMKVILDKGKIAWVLAAIFGPFSYFSAMQMGALEMENIVFSLCGLAIVWTLYMYCFQQLILFYRKFKI